MRTGLISLLSSPRGLASLILVAEIATIGGAWTYEHMGYLPCELCYKERVPYYAAFVLAPVAAMAAQTGRASLARGAFLLMALLFAGNAALSIYHSGVEWKIFPGPSDCSGALTTAATVDDFMQQLRKVKVVRCDEPTLWVLGLTLANWNVVVAAVLAGLASYAGVLLARREARAGA